MSGPAITVVDSQVQRWWSWISLSWYKCLMQTYILFWLHIVVNWMVIPLGLAWWRITVHSQDTDVIVVSSYHVILRECFWFDISEHRSPLGGVVVLLFNLLKIDMLIGDAVTCWFVTVWTRGYCLFSLFTLLYVGFHNWVSRQHPALRCFYPCCCPWSIRPILSRNRKRSWTN